jgi:tetratricopeptide (TPR) repeat protein
VKNKRKPAFTKKFIIIISLIYSALIIATAFLFDRAVSMDSGTVRETIFESSNEILLERTRILADRADLRNPGSISSAGEYLRSISMEDHDILYILVFSRTEDDNYFRLTEKFPVNSGLTMDIGERESVQDAASLSYLKEGLIRPAIDPEIYSKDHYSWQNVYQPLKVGKKTYALQFMVRPSAYMKATDSFNSVITGSRRTMLMVSAGLILCVLVLTAIFSQNHSMLVKKLSEYIQKAASGNLDINIKAAGDPELNELAMSFNTLVEEMKTRKESQEGAASAGTETGGENESEEDSLIMKELFRTGVLCLKENRLSEAITIFRLIISVRPEGFSSYFNLGVACAKAKLYGESLSMFRRAREANPSYEMTDRYIERVEKLILKNAAIG